jgi:hypothetical protein
MLLVLGALLITPASSGVIASLPKENLLLLQPDYNWPMKWQECAAKAAKEYGHSEDDVHKFIRAIGEGAIRGDSDFMALIVAIIAVESQFHVAARSSSGAVGLMQIMPIGATEAERQCPHIKHLGNKQGSNLPIKLLDPVNNVRYGSCLLAHYLNEVQGNTFLALTLYNGGYKQLTRFEGNATLANETHRYVFRVHQQLRKCQ